MASDRHNYAVRLVARNYLVPWPSPIWWRFWEKIPQRKGFHVTLMVEACDALEAGETARGEIAREMERKAANPPGDPYRLEVERAWISAEPIEDAGFKHWFSEEEV